MASRFLIQNPEQWNQLVEEHQGSFLQSWSWGQFQESIKRKAWAFCFDQSLLCLLIKHPLPLGHSYLYIPRGPLGQWSLKAKELFYQIIKQIAQKEKSIFLKIEPDLGFPPEQLLAEGFRPGRPIQPSQTLVLDLSQPREQLLSQMHPKTRYNIRLSQRQELSFELDQKGRFLRYFYQLLKQTAERDRFKPFSWLYYKKMFEVLGPPGLIKLFLAKRDKDILAAHLVCLFNQQATYLHGASDYRFRQLMAPYFLHWQTIAWAQDQGMKSYDFWGIDQEKWPGLTRFKKGFGGQRVVYPGSFDLVFKKVWFGLYQLSKKTSRLIR